MYWTRFLIMYEVLYQRTPGFLLGPSWMVRIAMLMHKEGKKEEKCTRLDSTRLDSSRLESSDQLNRPVEPRYSRLISVAAQC